MNRLLFTLVLASGVALASPPMPTPGPLEVTVDTTAEGSATLQTRALHRGGTLTMHASFLAPPQGTTAALVFRLVGGTVTAPAGSPVQGARGSDAAQYRIAVDLTGTNPGQTVDVPFSWTPTGQLASSVEVTLETTGTLRSSGVTGFLLAFDENAVATHTTARDLLEAQRAKLFADPALMRAARTANATAPFDPAAFSDAMQQPSAPATVPAGNGGNTP